MHSKFLKATPGWGTGEIDQIINEWLQERKINIIKISHNSHTETFTDYYGINKEGTVYTAVILYENIAD